MNRRGELSWISHWSVLDVLDQLPGLIGVHALDGTIVYMNPAAASALGYQPAELAGKKFSDLLTPPVAALFAPAMERLQEQRSGEGLMAVVTKDGHERLWWYRHVLIEGAAGELYVLGDSTDVTELQNADEAVQESEARFRYLAENIHQVFSIRDPRTLQVLYLSPAFEDVWGVTRQALFENPTLFLETIHPDDRAVVLGNFALSAQGQATSMEYRILRPDGTVRWIQGRSFPMRNEAGEVHRVVGISEDITEHKQADEALRKAKEDAEAATRAKSELLANVSHEIRNPLTVIFGMTDMLVDAPLEGEHKECVERIRASAELLHTLTDDLLELSKGEARKLELRPRSFELRPVVETAVGAFLVNARNKGIELTVCVDPESPPQLIGDPDRLGQVMTNLIANALKFTEEGTISVHAARERTDEASGCVIHFSVRDTGVGIPEQEAMRIFEPFAQAHVSTADKRSGYGLGLAICWQLVQLMQGRIWVESEVGRGSTFHFTARFGLP
jgi:PAS domain S-box-containing protein